LVELVQIVDNIFRNLGIKVVLKINNRKILSGIAETIGESELIVEITMAIDKLDKIGLDNVNSELVQKGISQSAIDRLQPILHLKGNSEEKLSQIEKVIVKSEIGLKGIAEVRSIFAYLSDISLNTEIELDLTLARGLDYYTGAIFEVKSKDVMMGSITGGGRYDDLTGIFGLPGVSGVGISFGADRIYDVMSQLGLFPDDTVAATHAMFLNFGENEVKYCLPFLSKLRSAGISSIIYPDSDKMKKQMNYANRNGIKFVLIAGGSEVNSGMITIKNMKTGEQQLINPEDIITMLSGTGDVMCG
jgi:histidyl-tRNA synthetase